MDDHEVVQSCFKQLVGLVELAAPALVSQFHS